MVAWRAELGPRGAVLGFGTAAPTSACARASTRGPGVVRPIPGARAGGGFDVVGGSSVSRAGQGVGCPGHDNIIYKKYYLSFLENAGGVVVYSKKGDGV